jgi:hypothetical protein
MDQCQCTIVDIDKDWSALMLEPFMRREYVGVTALHSNHHTDIFMRT